MTAIQFRFAKKTEVPLILQFIRELAEYEGLIEEVIATEELLQEWLFEKKTAEVIFGVYENQIVGFALFFHNFSTFLGRSGMYLEDLYVRKKYRGRGFGKAFLTELAKIGVARGCGRLEWWCLDSNQPSIAFYLKMEAVPMDEWTVYRIAGSCLKELAQE
ncbi:GNAT family N-acetyltransferase [Listeria fleischmannii]|uniref:GNAT family N-acetyltransferase n=1 Tax=Listeria fleischmannii TaxID=1069827 RepID=A0A841YH10_9LIST|nr:GNAT family N-acetyltransferase [Listeria fleischmannii]MBC1399434.1 GNAT family N-acetyltransferase [Listeria fleischmannii]MBC1427838.1 GNAT family N-acetyltransferase [Listeria fleischmannii]